MIVLAACVVRFSRSCGKLDRSAELLRYTIPSLYQLFSKRYTMLMCKGSSTALARAGTRDLLEQQHTEPRQREHYNARVHGEGRVHHQQRTARYRCDHPASALTQ